MGGSAFESGAGGELSNRRYVTFLVIATALVYHTSYQKFEGEEDVCVLVGRYHDELVKHDGTWKISRLVFEIMWGERRADSAGYLEAVGGRGPQVPNWP